MIRLSHGYFQGGVQTLPQLSPTIDAHIACWHVLIGEKMEEIKCNQVGQITAQGYTEMTGRVYGQEGISPTINTCCGGHHEPKILEEPIAYDEQNDYLRKDGTVGSLTTNCGNDAPRNGLKLIEPNCRVRKLTERECFKLMGVKQEDFEKIRKNQSKSSCYHLAGDSICCSVLMAIFGQMFDINWKEKINETVEEIIK